MSQNGDGGLEQVRHLFQQTRFAQQRQPPRPGSGLRGLQGSHPSFSPASAITDAPAKDRLVIACVGQRRAPDRPESGGPASCVRTSPRRRPRAAPRRLKALRATPPDVKRGISTLTPTHLARRGQVAHQARSGAAGAGRQRLHRRACLRTKTYAPLPVSCVKQGGRLGVCWRAQSLRRLGSACRPHRNAALTAGPRFSTSRTSLRSAKPSTSTAKRRGVPKLRMPVKRNTRCRQPLGRETPQPHSSL